jgi:hypothetical protein
MVGGERVKVLDFGIAKLAEKGLGRSDTRTGAILGSPGYIILYEMLAGQAPFIT